MPAVRTSQVKKADDVLALCQPGGGPIEAFDAAVTALDPDERELALRQLARTHRQLHGKLVQLNDIAQALEALQTAAAYRAIVLGVEYTNGGAPPAARVHLALLGQTTRLVAGVLPGFQASELADGDEVEVVQTGAQHWGVRRWIGVHERHGVVGRVAEVLDGTLLRVTRGPDTLLLRAVGTAAAAVTAAAGDQRALLGRMVSYDEALGLAFGLFGEREAERFLLREVPSVRREDLILSPRTVRQLETELMLPLRHPEIATAFGVGGVKFVIFAGPPGIGKTHAARWIATELGRPVYLTNGAEVASMWYGESEEKLRMKIRAAQAEPDGAVFIWDEAEAMLVERGTSQVGVEDRIVSVLLAETDGFVHRGNVVYVLTTNRVDKMDQALRRSLRATTITFERPDAARTRALFQLYLKDVTCLDARLETLAEHATRVLFTPADALGQAVLRDGARLPLLPSMLASGALVRASCERACRTGLARHLQANGTAGTPGIYRDELLTAVADELDAVAKTLTVGNLAHALTLPAGTTAEQVVALEPPTGTARHRFVGRPLHI